MKLPSLILASNSSRRADLLRQSGIDFRSVPSEAAELHHDQLTAREVSQINAYRKARLDALKQCSDFAKALGIGRVQTHCGFIPEYPKDALYEGTVAAIREITEHCAANGQSFLMETGQETPTTMLRMLKDVNNTALGVGLDTANLILYGKANPVDA